jgi:hypothetical protein
MEEMPSLNMLVHRLKVAILPLVLPSSGPVTHSGESLTTGKSHGKKPDRFSLNMYTHTTIMGPHTTIKVPHTTIKGPHTTIKGPHTTIKGPHTTIKGPHTTIKGPHTTPNTDTCEIAAIRFEMQDSYNM